MRILLECIFHGIVFDERAQFFQQQNGILLTRHIWHSLKTRQQTFENFFTSKTQSHTHGSTSTRRAHPHTNCMRINRIWMPSPKGLSCLLERSCYSMAFDMPWQLIKYQTIKINAFHLSKQSIDETCIKLLYQ